MTLIIGKNTLYETAVNAAFVGQAYYVEGSGKGKSLTHDPVTVEASFTILAGSLSEAVAYEMKRLVAGHENGRFQATITADFLEPLDIALRFGIVDIRTDEERAIAEHAGAMRAMEEAKEDEELQGADFATPEQDAAMNDDLRFEEAQDEICKYCGDHSCDGCDESTHNRER